MQRLLYLIAWFSLTLFTLFLTFNFYVALSAPGMTDLISQPVVSLTTPHLTAYASLPASPVGLTSSFQLADARPLIINRYFKRYNSPLQELGLYLVTIADANQVDPFLVTAIAQQESNLCKKERDYAPYNCWGWGIHSQATIGFSSYTDAINTVVAGLKRDYYDRGRTTIETIAPKYTSSVQEWIFGVNQFYTELLTSPE